MALAYKKVEDWLNSKTGIIVMSINAVILTTIMVSCLIKFIERKETAMILLASVMTLVGLNSGRQCIVSARKLQNNSLSDLEANGEK